MARCRLAWRRRGLTRWFDRPIEAAVSDQERCDADEGAEVFGLAFVAAVEAWAAGQPGSRAGCSRPPSGDAPGTVRTRFLGGRYGAGCRACGASGAGGRSRSPCLRGACRGAVDAVLAGTGSAGCRERAVQVRGCRVCSRRKCRAAPFCGPHAGGVDRAARPVEFPTGAQMVEDDAVEAGPIPGPGSSRRSVGRPSASSGRRPAEAAARCSPRPPRR